MGKLWFPALIATVLLAVGPAPTAAAADLASGKNTGSSDLPWVIGLAIVLVLVVAAGLLRLRRSARRGR